MAINLSANTQTTGPVAREVFDPNQGFQSGLEGVARGIQQVGSTVNKFAQAKQNQDRKQGIVDNKLAGTNASVYDTGMRSAYANYDTVMGNSESTEEDRTAAEASLQQYQGEFTSESFDPQGEVPSEYYSNYIKTSVALRDSLESRKNIGFQNRKQLKVIQQEIAGASQFEAAANGNASTSPLIDEIGFSISNNQDPNSLASTLNDPEIYYKEVATSLDKTSSITFSRIAGLPPVEQAAQLDELEIALQELAKSESPALQAEVATMYSKLASARNTIGVAGSKEREEANKASDATAVEKLEIAEAQLPNIAAQSASGVITAAAVGQDRINLLFDSLSSDATETQVNTQQRTLGMYYVQLPKPDGNSILNEATFKFIKDGIVPELKQEDFVTNKYGDQRALLNSAEVQKAYQAEVKSLAQQITTAVRDGDYSVLARVSGAMAQNWENKDWLLLNNYVEEQKKADNPLFKGGPSFRIMPKLPDGVSYNSMESANKIAYIDESLQLNGADSLKVIQDLESSGRGEDRDIGISMRLQQAGILEQSLEFEDIGSSVNSGASMQVKNEDGESILVPANLTQYYELSEGSGPSPLELLKASASQQGDKVLAAKYGDMKAGMIAKAFVDNPNLTGEEYQYTVAQYEKNIANALGSLTRTASGAIIAKPTYDADNPIQNEIRSHQNRVRQATDDFIPFNQFSDLEDEDQVLVNSINSVIVDHMLKNKVAFTPQLRIIAQAENSPALATALYDSDIELDKSKERAAFERGTLNAKDKGGKPYINVSRKHIINGVEHFVPQFLDADGRGYSANVIKQPDGSFKTFTIPVTDVLVKQRDAYRSEFAVRDNPDIPLMP
jgi:hypothetical protein